MQYQYGVHKCQCRAQNTEYVRVDYGILRTHSILQFRGEGGLELDLAVRAHVSWIFFFFRRPHGRRDMTDRQGREWHGVRGNLDSDSGTLHIDG